MSQNIRITLPVYTEHDHICGCDCAVASLTPETVARIKALAASVDSMNVYEISIFDYSCEMFDIDHDEAQDDEFPCLVKPGTNSDVDGRVDVPLLKIHKDTMRWSGVWKSNTSIRWSTESVNIADLEDGADINLCA